MEKNRLTGFDLIRTFAILTVFLGHIINRQTDSELLLLIIKSLSPGLTMSLLGFISAVLLTKKYQDNYNGKFYINRFSRIYISLFICLGAVSIFHFLLGKDVINQHSILHYMGLSVFFDFFSVTNNSSLGQALWFISVIVFMYFMLPTLTALFNHKNGLFHLLLVILFSFFMNFLMYGTQSSWNVIISFAVGAYIGLKNKLESICEKNILYFLFSSLFLLILCGMATSRIIPYLIRELLFPFYPLAFVPLFIKSAQHLPKFASYIVTFYAEISYEFYILHVYFINDYFSEIFPNINGLIYEIVIAFFIILTISFIMSKLAKILRLHIVSYLLEKKHPAET
ncbi:MAG: acyltransferase [Desulfobacterales bacterium]|nr:acyltransferase [Desulfobacterales bacterium]